MSRLYNLIKLGLIQKVTNLDKKNKNSIEENEQGIREKPKNNTIYYSISSAGIFYLFRTNPGFINIKTILSNKEDGLFINFLYPLFGLYYSRKNRTSKNNRCILLDFWVDVARQFRAS